MTRFEELNAATTAENETVEAYLMRKHSNGEWRVEGNVYLYAFQVPGLTIATEYRWASDEQGLYAVNGRAQNLTPQFDRRGLEITEARSKVDPRELAIYDRWNELFAENDDEEGVTGLVAVEFETTADELATVYQRVAEALIKI